MSTPDADETSRPERLPEAQSLVPVARLGYDAALHWIDARVDSPAWLVTIDGRSGSGKTVLSSALERSHPEAQILHLDDLYRDWDRLPSGVVRARHMAERWRSGFSPSYRPTRWPGTPDRGIVRLDPNAPLIVEGCGATWVGRGLAQAQLWLEVERETRRTRALRRDGETFQPFWFTWEEQESAWYSAHPPRPQVVIELEAAQDDPQ